MTPVTGSGATTSASPAVPESLSPSPASSAAPYAMHAALDYAAKIKHAQKDFLTSQGIHAIID